MKKLLYLSVCVALAAGCASTGEGEHSANETKVDQAAVMPNHKLTVEIGGMVCEMGCGGSIRKELYALGGVSSVDFDFEEEREMNVATVSYDDNKVDIEKIVEVLSHMNDGQFTVGKLTSESIDTSTNNAQSSNEDEESLIDVSSTSFKTPNLLDLFADLIL